MNSLDRWIKENINPKMSAAGAAARGYQHAIDLIEELQVRHEAEEGVDAVLALLRKHDWEED